MTGNIIQALKTFEADQNHRKIYGDPNELIRTGFPGAFLLPLINVFKSSDGYKYFHNGEIVSELIGISHLSLIDAIARHFGVSPETGATVTGRGFAMSAQIDGIRKLLNELLKSENANATERPR